jgi:hypothetical protein
MREVFRKKEFRGESLAKIILCNQIIEQYVGQGLRLTLRQLYYQLVIRNAIKNKEREYKNLSSLVSDARLAGIMDWDAIEDRIRQPVVAQEFADLNDLVNVALNSYRLPRWKGQGSYCELWVEKDALAGVLRPLAREYHVTMMVNRGYSSQSAMYESANRFREAEEQDKKCLLLYLGDHDPSGEDMVRDIADRLQMFLCDLEVEKLALTMDQVEQYDSPPNPAKMEDPRAAKYVDQHGASSWEVDALPPEALGEIIRGRLVQIIDQEKMDAVEVQEEKDKKWLKAKVGGKR